ncbi:MAG: DUF4864 domain-containing protein [Betaproteobacteria bacterium]
MKNIRFRVSGLLACAAMMLVCVPAVQAQRVAEPAAPAAKPEKLSAADRQKIQRVITLQIKAFERNDEALAFSYSTPEIRRMFGSSRTFMEMVRSSYSVLFMNTSKEFLEATVVDGQVVQPLHIVTRDGETLVALYTVARQAGSPNDWRIGGCELAPSTLQFI